MEINITQAAVEKIGILMGADKSAEALRLSVVGGGCSGFQYRMAFETEKQPMDKVFTFGNMEVYVDPISLLYLDGITVDYVETLEASGFKFNNPKATRTCGCGSSFSA